MKSISKLTESLNITVKSSVAYILVSLITKGLSFITLPIFTRLMPSSEIGVVSLYNSWFSILSEIISFGMLSGGFNVAMKKFSNKRNQYCSSLLFLLIIFTSVFTLVFLLSGSFFEKLTTLSKPLLILMIFGLYVSPAYNIWLAKNRYEMKYQAVSAVSIIEAILASVLSVICVIYGQKYEIQELGTIRLYAQNLVMYVFSTIFVFVLIKEGKTFYKKEYWKFSIISGAPLIVHQIAAEILSVSDRTMIGNMVGKSEVGIYSTIYSLGAVSNIIWNAVNSSYIPYLYENIDFKEKKKDLNRSSDFILILYGVVVALIVLFAPEIIDIMTTKEYLNSVDLVPPIAAGVYFVAVSNLYSNILIYYHKSQYVMISTVIAAIFNLFANYYGIKYFGYYAAAYTTFISYILMILVQVVVCRNIFKNNPDFLMPYNEKHISLISFLTAIFCLVSIILYKYNISRYIFIFGLFVLFFSKRKFVIDNLKAIITKRD